MEQVGSCTSEFWLWLLRFVDQVSGAACERRQKFYFRGFPAQNPANAATKLAFLKIAEQVAARASGLTLGAVFVPGDGGHINVQIMTKPGHEFRTTVQLGMVDALFLEISHKLDTDVALQIVLRVRLRFVLDRASLKDAAVRSYQKMVG